MKALVEAQEIGVKYESGDQTVTALESATCIVNPGDRIALVGPSGSGKSTLLQLLGGIEAPTAGQIQWPALGKRSELRPKKVGFVFQMPSLLAPLSVLENVELPLLLAHASREEARSAAIQELDRIGLKHLANKLPEELSGGQSQRVAFARAMTTRPPLILADEPTGQLDHPTAEHLFEVLFDALRNTQSALVVATHDSRIAEKFDTLWQMNKGRLEVRTS
ncbi:ABC transporter ATP-binding protein [Cohnella candidum]|uniref:ABC transporter ATP-binding protein n=1 Tax=Cohnella candidum TaxID=2674991 RepID=A0A3G3JW19_9BACL|nr:ABC transporter ATP-binding protein [Cohnella candidum]AYQ72450.1 ABC transporter ATP-binding protein [Cohnella candidum]